MNITIANRDELFIVSLEKVAYFKAEGHFTRVFYLNGTKLLLPCGLSKVFEKILAITYGQDMFIQMGRSLIVCKRNVCCINSAKESITISGTDNQLINIHVPKSVLKTVIKDYFTKY